ncbi:hypothetical protein FS837_006340 [Tulasnella sp. UAMH 9824]|nr:hypothetical protein FS837_006340 [Tulasnella sp. UAMH 9824]
MNAYFQEDGWILVKIDRKDAGSRPAVGFVPANYIEEGEDPAGGEFEGHATAVVAARAGGIVAVTLYDFKAERDDELTVMEGEKLTILDKEDDEWWKCRNWIGSEGVVPASYLEARIESAGEVDGNAAVEVDAEAVRKMQEYAAAAAAKANRLFDESRRKREQVAREARIRQEQGEVKTIKAETSRQREEKDYAKEILLRDVDVMVQASSKSSSSEISKSSVSFDSLLKFDRPPADITKITAELKGREVESKVTTQRVPPPDPFSDLSSWAAGLPESTFSKKFESTVLIDDIGLGITWISSMPVKKLGEWPSKDQELAQQGMTTWLFESRFEREAATWRNLRHPHILKFLGTFRRDGHIYLVSPFINNGTLVEYLSLRPHTNRIRLLCGTADAVQYLHKEGVVHGSLKASNILINDGGHSLLCDFGLTTAVDSRTSTAMQGAGTFRWQSPELWNNAPKSFESDVYAFGMTIAEVLTGEVPFHDLISDMAVMYAVILGDERPPKIPVQSSNGVSYERIWEVASDCWAKTPSDRIPMSVALQRIRNDPSLAFSY